MNRRLSTALMLSALCAVAASGCDFFSSDDDSELDDFAELQFEGELEEGLDEANSPTPPLREGDEFPLVKVVEQKLTQALPQGLAVSTVRQEFHFALRVEEIRDQSTRFGIRYDRVRYEQEVGGRRVEFDSGRPGGSIPVEAQAYAGLPQNGFSFWIGPDNQVSEVVGFNEFLQRCVQFVDPERQAAVLQQFSGGSSLDGAARFVDDAVGLLPIPDDENGLRVGMTWELQPTRFGQPLPMTCSKRCLLKSLDEQTAEIDIMGQIAPTSPALAVDGVRVDLREGFLRGHCTVDLRTGLPTRTQFDRYLVMQVQLADGAQYEQRKEVLTTVRAPADAGSLGNEAEAAGENLAGPGGPLFPTGTATQANGAESATFR